MPETRFRVELAPEAEADLYEIVEYWSEQGESWRGENISEISLTWRRLN